MASCEFSDEDGVSIIATLFLTEDGKFGELDFWKVNDAPLIRLPSPEGGMNKPLANGDELCKVIEEFSELEWRRFQTREVKVRLGNGEIYQQDNSTFPPFTSVRFKKENTEFVEKLKKSVEGYEGSLVWKMFSHQRISEPNVNWVIRPAIVDQVVDAAGGQDVGNWQRYMSDHNPDFALKAYADFLGLATYVREELKRTEDLK